ncbi:unnamed protein product [Polarella glacialis]|uniref:Apple domain-containing protein n=1 Tax=Polarella glacialis TaxID=89957 RepID=A0A813I9B5_POLGL|nr:unnamed protein product [Polarella glacialis]
MPDSALLVIVDNLVQIFTADNGQLDPKQPMFDTLGALVATQIQNPVREGVVDYLGWHFDILHLPSQWSLEAGPTKDLIFTISGNCGLSHKGWDTSTPRGNGGMSTVSSCSGTSQGMALARLQGYGVTKQGYDVQTGVRVTSAPDDLDDMTMRTCAQACDDHEDCQVWSFGQDTDFQGGKNCWLYSATSGWVVRNPLRTIGGFLNYCQ